LVVVGVLSILGGCADEPKSAFGYYAGRVYIIEASLPATTQYTDLGKISVKSMWYGSTDSLYPEFAQKARERGANVIVNVEAYLAPSPTGFAWAAPHLEGRALRVSDPGKLAESGVHFRTF
jgi:hypothetical protein